MLKNESLKNFDWIREKIRPIILIDVLNLLNMLFVEHLDNTTYNNANIKPINSSFTKKILFLVNEWTYKT